MQAQQYNSNRMGQLEELLEIEYEKMHEFEKAISICDGISQRISLRQQIKRELTPRLRSLEKEYAELLASDTPAEKIPVAEAEFFVGELLSAVVKCQEYSPRESPTEMIRLLLEIKTKLENPGKTAAAKLKIALPIIPLIASYEMELDTENAITQIWRTIRNYFRGLVSHPK